MTTTTQDGTAMTIEWRTAAKALADGPAGAHRLADKVTGEEDPRYGVRPHGVILAVVRWDEHGKPVEWATFAYNRIERVYPSQNPNRFNGWISGVFWGHYFDSLEAAKADYVER